MTLYEKKFYESDLPRTIKSLETIAKSLEALVELKSLEVIISDPGDEDEHITQPRQYNLPDDYGPITMD